MRTKNVTFGDVGFAALGAALVTCAFAFALVGTPPLPKGLMVMLGIPSPLTGMTRSFVALAHGDVAAAFAFHPLGPLCFLASVLAVLNIAVLAKRGSRPRALDALLHLRYGGIALAVVFGAVWIRQIVVYS